MSRGRLPLACALGAVLAACGAAPAKGPASPAAAPAPEQKETSAPGYGQPAGEAPAGGGGDAERSTLDETRSPSPALARADEAEAAFETSARELREALATDQGCEVARKALASMERSADRICELNGPGDPGKRCAYARERVQAARDKVSRSCGS